MDFVFVVGHDLIFSHYPLPFAHFIAQINDVIRGNLEVPKMTASVNQFDFNFSIDRAVVVRGGRPTLSLWSTSSATSRGPGGGAENPKVSPFTPRPIALCYGGSM